MSAGILVVGLNHKTAPIGLLERLSVQDERLAKALHQLLTYEHVVEGAVLSTCNRIEVYATATRFHGGAQDLRNFLAEFCHVAPEDFVDHLYTYHDEGAARHLFRVASGIDSMVVGESEILGQVKRAYQSALAEDAIHRLLGRAFRLALRVGKRARTETAISRNPASVSSAAVDLARRAFPTGTLEGRRVAIVGAGKMGRLALRALARAGATDVTIVNRSEARAENLAQDFSATAHPLSAVEDVLAEADILICSTTSPETIIDRALMTSALRRRPSGSPLFIVDIAVPRDVDPTVAELEGVVLRDIDDLRGVVEASLGSRLDEVARVEEIIASEITRFVEWERASEIAPTLSALVARTEEIRAAEVRRASTSRNLSGKEQAAVDRITKQIVAKLLHGPLERARELAGSKQGQTYLSALRELFGLDDELGP